MAPHTALFIAFLAFSALLTLFWHSRKLKKRTSDLKWSHDMLGEHCGLGHLDASDREHLHLGSGP
jgi:hypothetical protein